MAGDRACSKCGAPLRKTRKVRELCGKCQGRIPTERICTTCDKPFLGAQRVCSDCRCIERECAGCGKRLRSINRFCGSCRSRERACETDGCETRFKGNGRLCGACRKRERTCETCGKSFRGDPLRCWACRTPERECGACGKQFRGSNRLCHGCIASERTCDGCGGIFRGKGRYCPGCSRSERTCGTCGKSFIGTDRNCHSCWRKMQNPEELAAKGRRWHNSRRARKLAAEVAGPVARSTYAAILASGPCVYCAAPAKTVDHVRPLARGGAEHESNLVPACKACNCQKSNRLLTEWRAPERIAHGVAHSEKVAAEYARQLALVAA